MSETIVLVALVVLLSVVLVANPNSREGLVSLNRNDHTVWVAILQIAILIGLMWAAWTLRNELFGWLAMFVGLVLAVHGRLMDNRAIQSIGLGGVSFASLLILRANHLCCHVSYILEK